MRYLPMFVIERSRRRDSEVAALASLAVFEAAYGRKDRAERFIRKAQAGVANPDESTVLEISEVESMLFIGSREEAVRGARSLSVDANLSSPALIEILAVLRKAGLKKSAAKADAILRARLKNHLLENGQIASEGQGLDSREANAGSGPDGHAGNGAAHHTPGVPHDMTDGLVTTQAEISAQVNDDDRSASPPIAPGDPKIL
jgi:hypothetical protein